MEYHKHKKNDDYTVHAKERVQDEATQVWTNIKPEHLEALLKQASIDGPLKTQWKLPFLTATQPAEKKDEAASLTFDECVKKHGAVVTEAHMNQAGSYSVHLKLNDGSVKTFPSLKKEHLEGVSGFMPSEE